MHVRPRRCYLILVDLEQAVAERLDFGSHAVRCGPIQEAGAHSVPHRHHGWETC
jgi:hypothetical protein